MLEIIKTKELLKNSFEDQVMHRKVNFITGNDSHASYIIELSENEVLPAHYHKTDIEIYYILNGKGKITTAKLVNEKLEYQKDQIVEKDDAFSIQPYIIHQIENVGQDLLHILAIAPKSHGNDDRYFVNFEGFITQ